MSGENSDQKYAGAVALEAPKKRGRPTKAEKEAREAELAQEAARVLESIATNAPRRRGRPSNAEKQAREAAQAAMENIVNAPRKRGRPSKNDLAARAAAQAAMETISGAPRKRGRPSKAEKEAHEAALIAGAAAIIDVLPTVLQGNVEHPPLPEDRTEHELAPEPLVDAPPEPEPSAETAPEFEPVVETAPELEPAVETASEPEPSVETAPAEEPPMENEAVQAVSAAAPEEAVAVPEEAVVCAPSMAESEEKQGSKVRGRRAKKRAKRKAARAAKDETPVVDFTEASAPSGVAEEAAMPAQGGVAVAVAEPAVQEPQEAAQETPEESFEEADEDAEDVFIPTGRKAAFHFSFWPTIVLAYIFPALGALTFIVPDFASYFYVASALCVFVPVGILILAVVLYFSLYEKNYYLSKGFLWGAVVSVALPVIVTLVAFGKCVARLMA